MMTLEERVEAILYVCKSLRERPFTPRHENDIRGLIIGAVADERKACAKIIEEKLKKIEEMSTYDGALGAVMDMLKAVRFRKNNSGRVNHADANAE